MQMLYVELTSQIINACFEVSNELGAGFLESVYQNALVLILRQKSMKVETEKPIAVMFRDENVGQFFADLLVDDKVLVELKAVKAILPEHKAQVINYLKATGIEVGLLVNFGVPKLEYYRLHR